MSFLRLVHINREQDSSSEEPRYWLVDAGRFFGEEYGAAQSLHSLTRADVGDWLSREGVSYGEIERVLNDLAQNGLAQIQLEPRVGPRIVRAWFDSVINPLLPSLEGEIAFVGHKNWTFAFRPPRLELIRPVRRYIEQRAWANLEQLLDLEVGLSTNVQAHDNTVENLLRAVRVLHGALLSNSEFIDLCASLLTPERLTEIGVTNVEQVFGAYPSEDRLALIAQYVVNRSGDQPSHHSTARFWNRNRETLLASLTLAGVREDYVGVMSFGDQLTVISDALVRQLRGVRRDLSLRYDMPYVVGDAGNSAA